MSDTNTLTQPEQVVVGSVRSTIAFPPDLWTWAKAEARETNTSVQKIIVTSLELLRKKSEQRKAVSRG